MRRHFYAFPQMFDGRALCRSIQGALQIVKDFQKRQRQFSALLFYPLLEIIFKPCAYAADFFVYLLFLFLKLALGG